MSRESTLKSSQGSLGVFLSQVDQALSNNIYGRNQSGCEKVKNVGFLASILWVFLTIYVGFALLKINMCFKHIEVSHTMSFDS